MSLFAALFYGAADFCGGLATRRTATIAVAALSQSAGFALLLLVRPFFPSHAVASDYLYGALGGLCGAFGLALFYHALSIGKMGVISPITAILAAGLPLAVGVARGEHLAPAQVAGIAIALIAIVLISLSTQPDGRREIATAGVKEAIVSGLALGGFYLCLAATHRAAGLDNLIGARVASIGFLVAAGWVMRTNFVPRATDWPLIVGAGLLDMTANALFVLATFYGYLSIAVVLTSLYPASTVFLARIVLNERLQALQKAGVVLALAGVVLISVR